MTIASLILLLLMLPCAFIFGFSVSQGGTCAVTAAKQLVYEGHGTLLTGFAIAVGASGLICLPLAWIFGNTVYLAHNAMISPELIAGAALLGIGAVINDACLFGTLSRISLGEVARSSRCLQQVEKHRRDQRTGWLVSQDHEGLIE